MEHNRLLSRSGAGQFARKPRPSLHDRVVCSKCQNPSLTRADFHPADTQRSPYSWCKRCGATTTKAWRDKNPARAALLGKRGNLKANYGITVEAYDALFVAQDGKCAICRGDGTRALAVDHCHETGLIRGLLCDSCNNGLGRFRDDADLLLRAAEYLTLDKNDGHKSA